MDPMMHWDFWWLTLGGVALLLALVNLIRAFRQKHGGWPALLFISLSCGALAMLFAYLGVQDWLDDGSWSSLIDCVPMVTKLSGGAMCVGILLNLAALCVHQQAENETKQEEADIHEKA